jgi:hypothetical protein
MANVDKPNGFRFAYTLHGGPPAIHTYLCTAGIIYPGDHVAMNGSGRCATFADGEAGFGVAATYVTAVADQTVYVYDDLINTVFTVQMDGAGLSDTIIGHANFYDITATTGSTVTFQSLHELDVSETTSKTLEILGLVDKPGNAWGIHGDVYVMFHVNERLQIAAVAS